MKLEEAMRMAAICGLKYVGEAVTNAEQVVPTLFITTDYVRKELAELYEEWGKWVAEGNGDEIPENIIQEENERLNKWFAEEITQTEA